MERASGRRRHGIAAAALALLALVACGRGHEYAARGVVIEADPAAHQVVIDHEDIPGLMPAMTMNFDVPDPKLFEVLKPGDAVRFTLEVEGRAYRVVAAESTGESPGTGGKSGLSGVVDEADPAPDFALVDQTGRPLALADLRGRIVVLDFIYTHCPGPCPTLTGLHVDLQKSLGPELQGRVRFVSITLDPDRDTPQALADYAKARGADTTTWSFLTGPPAQVKEIVAKYGVGTIPQATGDIEHVIATFVIDGEGRIVRRWLGFDHKVEKMRAELERLARAPAA